MFVGKMKLLIITVIISIFLDFPCYAITLLTEKEALKYVFQGTDKIDVITKTVSDKQMEKINRILTEIKHSLKINKISNKIIPGKTITFYLGKKNKKIIRVALILTEDGRWGPITFIISMDLKGTIQNIAIMKSTETRGRSIARRSFLNQFLGKNSNNFLLSEEKINSISGATVSSNIAIFTIKKAIILYEEIIYDNITG